MKKNNAEIEKYRVSSGRMTSTAEDGNNGLFVARGPGGLDLICIVSDGYGWDHISVEVEIPSPLTKQRLPRWEEMCFIKDLFWGEDECVIQYHPKKKDYINCHNYVLHLWKPQHGSIPMPPRKLV